jgi:hypothetical protein
MRFRCRLVRSRFPIPCEPLGFGIASCRRGMWVFNNLPLCAQGPPWLPAASRLGGASPSAAVRFNNGGSGSFVSPDGRPVMTNHHVAADTLSKLSTPAKDYHRDGFRPDQGGR